MTHKLSLCLSTALLACLAVGVCPGQTPEPTVQDSSLKEATRMVRDGKGSVVIFHLYASWCPPCKKEVPDLIKVCERYKSHPFQMLAFSLDQKSADLKDFLKAQKVNFEYRRVLLPPAEEARRLLLSLGMTYDLKAIPYSAVFDPSGKMVKEWKGGESYKGYVNLLDGLYLQAQPTPAKDPPPTPVPAAANEPTSELSFRAPYLSAKR